ncbi:metal-sensitive transcriptional regulator [Proteinivorax hydrogeniformans]|uniref:Metal-sensitive transcriptional regulator n=1 Tax=Proteinivorax hydrogeniformans TaxID=1826727 RepID=A0AAU8HPS4_9FIRM
MGCEKQKLQDRLKRIEGQLRGIQKMVDDERYCVDILTQLAAVRAGVNKVGLMILEGHTKGCVAQAFDNDNQEEAIEELLDVMGKFLK